MNAIAILASIPRHAAWLEVPKQPKASGRYLGLPALRSMISAWDERKRFRWDLEQMSRDYPHLIDDIGLTRREVEAEISKPFWQA